MRAARFGLLFCVFLLTAPVWAQQTSIQPDQLPAPAPRDTQAVNIVNQALATAGGAVAISAIQDYTASGNVTYHSNPEAQGTITLSGLGLYQVRQDANLQTGVRSLVMSNGQTTTKESGVVKELPVQVPMMTSGLMIPCWQLAAALNSPDFSFLYKGIVEVDGRSAHDIRIELFLPDAHDTNGVIAEYFAADFFVDAATFQVLMTQDAVPGHLRHLIRMVRYSDYRPVGGVLVPFLIDQQIDSQRAQTIQLQQIALNTGVQDSAFVL
jgi:hypothetical protein